MSFSTAVYLLAQDEGGGDGGSGGGGIDFLDMLDSGADYAELVVAALISLAGVIVLGWGALLMGKKLLPGDRGQQGWGMAIGAVGMGGLMLFGGWQLFTGLGETANDTVDNFSNTSMSRALDQLPLQPGEVIVIDGSA